VSLLPILDAEEIRDRWLKPYLMMGTGEVPNYFQAFTVQYLSYVLRSYPSRLLDRNIVTLFIHPMQRLREPASPALAKFSHIVRMWKNRAPGSEAIAIATPKSEIDQLIAEVGSDTKKIINVQHVNTPL
jgi:hypothetical protein